MQKFLKGFWTATPLLWEATRHVWTSKWTHTNTIKRWLKGFSKKKNILKISNRLKIHGFANPILISSWRQQKLNWNLKYWTMFWSCGIDLLSDFQEMPLLKRPLLNDCSLEYWKKELFSFSFQWSVHTGLIRNHPACRRKWLKPGNF